MIVFRIIIVGLFLSVRGLLSQDISPTVGVNNLGSTGLFFVPAPQTLKAGHIALGLKNHLNTPVLNLNVPVHMAIGISDRTEFYASTNGYTVGAFESVIDKGLGVKINIFQSNALPLSMFVNKNIREKYNATLDTTYTENQQLSSGVLTTYKLLNAHIFNQLGVHQTRITSDELLEYTLSLGFGLSRTLFREIQLMAELNSEVRKERSPNLMASIGARIFVLGNVQFGLSTTWISDVRGYSRQYAGGLTISTQTFKTSSNPKSSRMSDPIINLLGRIGLIKLEQSEDTKFPEYFVSRDDRNLPEPPPLTEFTEEPFTIIGPEYEVAKDIRLPYPPDLQQISTEIVKR